MGLLPSFQGGQAEPDRPFQQGPLRGGGLLEALGHGPEEEPGEGILLHPGPESLAQGGVVIETGAVKIAGGQGGEGSEIGLVVRVPGAGEGNPKDVLRPGGAG